jgi:hypothetical protein
MYTNIVPTTPGAGLVWDTSNLRTHGIIRVASAPRFDNSTLFGTNFIVSGASGMTNGTYYVLTSTNAALPLNQWIRLATNVFDANGNFSFTNAVSLSTPQQFFLLELP